MLKLAADWLFDIFYKKYFRFLLLRNLFPNSTSVSVILLLGLPIKLY